MNLEEYKTIKDYEGLYEISNFGNIRNSKGMTRKLTLGKDGYQRIGLCKDGKKKYFLIHRLVAIAFIPNDDVSRIFIDHIDRNKINNHISNLRWVTQSCNSLNRDYFYRKQDGNHHIDFLSKELFRVIFTINKKTTREYFKTLEDAIIYRDNFMLNNKK